MKYFLLYLVVEILQFVHEISSFREVLYKRGDLKNFSRFTYKHKKQSPGGVLSEDVLKNFAKFTEKCLCWSLFFNKVAGLKPETDRSSHWRCSVKRGVLKKGHTGVSEPGVHRSSTQNRCFWIIHKIHRRKPVLKFLFKVFFLILGPATLLSKTPPQVLSCETSKIFKNIYILKNICERLFLNFFNKETPTQVFCCEFCELFRNTYFVKDLRTAGSETPVWGSIFNKVGSQMGWRHLTVLERDSSTGISLWISWNFLERFFCRTPPSNHISHDVYFFFLQISEVCSLKSIYLVEQW